MAAYAAATIVTGAGGQVLPKSPQWVATGGYYYANNFGLREIGTAGVAQSSRRTCSSFDRHGRQRSRMF